MRKRSILLSCIAALMVIVMFVGCDNGPVWPITSVKSGYINQIGDFLDGQAFDGSKFEIYVTYDNSSTPVLTTGTVYLESNDGTVDSGDYVRALAGTDVYGDEVYARGAATTYDVTTIDVTLRDAAKVYAVDDSGKIAIPASDLQVVAHYLKEGQDKTMELNSTEFSLPDTMTPVFEDGATETTYTVTVTTEVGGKVTGTVNVKATTEPVVDPVVELVDIVSVEAKSALSIPKLNYAEVPAPSWDDVSSIKGILTTTAEENKATGEEIPAELLSGIRLFYIDGTTGLEVTNPNFVAAGTSSLKIAAEYNGIVKVDNTNTVSVPKTVVIVRSASIFDNSAFIVGSALPALSDYTDDLTVTVKYGEDGSEKYQLADMSEVEFAYYYTDDSKFVPYTGTTVPETLYINATYRDVTGNAYADALNVKPITAGETTYNYDSLTAELAASFEPPAKQYYDDITDVTGALSARDLVLTLTVDGKNVPVDSKNLKVYYSSTDLGSSDKFTPGEFTDSVTDDAYGNDALSNVETIYAIAEYTVVTDASNGTTTVYYASAPVTLADPDPENLELVVNSSSENNVIGTEVTVSLATRNDLGYVDTEIADDYTIIDADGTAVETLTVPEKDTTYEVRYTGIESRTLIGELELKAGVKSVTIGDVSIRLKSNYKQLIDEKLDTNVSHYEAVIADEVTEDVKIISVDESASTVVKRSTYDVTFMVEYVNSTGATVKERFEQQSLTATAWIDSSTSADFEVTDMTDGTQAGSYALDDFTVALKSDKDTKNHGGAEITVTSITDGTTTVDADSEVQSLEVEAGDEITVKFTFVGSNGTERNLSLSVDVTE